MKLGSPHGLLKTALLNKSCSDPYKGRKPTIDTVELRRLRDEEKLGPVTIARRRGIGRASVYRLLGTHKQET